MVGIAHFMKCPACGGAIEEVEGTPPAELAAPAGCWKLFQIVHGRGQDAGADARTHRLAGLAYKAQHPGDPRALRAALIELCLLLDLDCDADGAAVAAIAEEAADLELAPPAALASARNVTDVLRVTDPAAREDSVRSWAESVWAAWAPHHGAVRRLAERVAA